MRAWTRRSIGFASAAVPVAALVAVLVTVLVTVLTAALSTPSRAAGPVRPASPASAALAAVLRSPFSDLVPDTVLRLGQTADWVEITADAVWTGSTGPDAVHRIDPRSRTVTASVPLPGEPCAGLASGFGMLWVPLCGDVPGLARVDLRRQRLVDVLPFGPAAAEGGVATSADSVWIVIDRQGTLVRLDPATGRLRQTVRVPAGSYNLKSSGGLLYVTQVEGAAVTVVDAATGAVLTTLPTGPHPRFLAAGGGFVWTLNQGDGTLTQISARTRRVVATVALGTPGHGGDIAFGQGKVLTTMMNTPLSLTDAATGQVEHQWVGPGGDSLGVGHGAIWLTDYDGGTIARIPLGAVGLRDAGAARRRPGAAAAASAVP